MKLELYLQKHGISVADFAEQIGRKRISVYSYIWGTRRPNEAAMVKIKEVTGGAVTPNDFFDLPGGGEGERSAEAPCTC